MLFILTPVLIRHMWRLKTIVLLHWCLIHAVLLILFQMTIIPKYRIILKISPSGRPYGSKWGGEGVGKLGV